MRKGEFAGMKKRPASRGAFGGTVDTIANDGMPDRSQMQTDLMLAAGVQFHLENSSPVETFLHPVVRDRMTGRLGIVSRDVALAGFVFIGDGQIDGPLRRLRNTFDEGQIAAKEGMIPEGSAARGVAFAGKCYGHQAGSASIQPMQSAHISPGSTDACQTVSQAAQHTVVVRSSVGGDGEQPGRLVDHHQVLVLIGGREREANHFLAPSVRVVGDGLRGLNPLTCVPDPGRTDIDLAGHDHVLGLPPGKAEVAGHALIQAFVLRHPPGG